MIKNLIGAAIGSSLVKSSPVTGGFAGAAIATAVPSVIARFSFPTMVAVGVGGYFLKRHLDKRNDTRNEKNVRAEGSVTGKEDQGSAKAPQLTGEAARGSGKKAIAPAVPPA